MTPEDLAMKAVLIESVQKDVIKIRRRPEWTDEEYQREYEKGKALALSAINQANNHEDLGRIVNAIGTQMDKATGKFDDLK